MKTSAKGTVVFPLIQVLLTKNNELRHFFMQAARTCSKVIKFKSPNGNRVYKSFEKETGKQIILGLSKDGTVRKQIHIENKNARFSLSQSITEINNPLSKSKSIFINKPNSYKQIEVNGGDLNNNVLIYKTGDSRFNVQHNYPPKLFFDIPFYNNTGRATGKIYLPHTHNSNFRI